MNARLPYRYRGALIQHPYQFNGIRRFNPALQISVMRVLPHVQSPHSPYRLPQPVLYAPAYVLECLASSASASTYSAGIWEITSLVLLLITFTTIRPVCWSFWKRNWLSSPNISVPFSAFTACTTSRFCAA